MTSEIRIYVEGGGDSAFGKATLRSGFNTFFRSLVDDARSKRIKWAVILLGPRDKCLSAFNTALKTHPDAFNILMVDAEGAVSVEPRQHLRDRDSWDVLAPEENCHLMVQTMEAWFVADFDALSTYYGDSFLGSAIPRTSNVEEIDKITLLSALERASQNTQKGRYNKIRHAADLLGRIDTTLVRQKAWHCDRLFSALKSRIH
ncbi:MAG: DUF4276 family protein [Chloroflexi bacterium]|nr:DUF4276 family protein [Chloroflexota bacterium]